MSNDNSVVQNIKCYEFNKNSLWLSIVHNKLWNRYSLDITRNFSYIKNHEIKKSSSSTYSNLTAATTLIDQHPLDYQLAKKL